MPLEEGTRRRGCRRKASDEEKREGKKLGEGGGVIAMAPTRN
jgi:hypothetical protein